jgi:proteasome lid subunit RPN8/RPN11
MRQTVLREIKRHAALGYPFEVVGGLLGSGTACIHLHELVNEAADSREKRFAVSAGRILAMEEEAVNRGLGVLGFYHSHPDEPAIPSFLDQTCAVPGYIYAIVSVFGAEAGDLTLWKLSEDGQVMIQLELVVGD